MAELSNTDLGRLDIDDAVNALLITEDTPGATEEIEVTTEETLAEEVTTSEAATRSDNPQSPEEDAEAVAEAPEEEEEVEGEDETEAEAELEETEEPEETEEGEEEDDNGVLFTTAEGEEVTREEAQRSYLRQADYTKKTQAVSELKDQVQRIGEQIGIERNVLAENLTMALNIIEPQLATLAQTDWSALATEDAYEYAEKRALFDQAQSRYNQIVQASQHIVAQQNAQNGEQRKSKLAAEGEALRMAIPELVDPKKGVTLRGNIHTHAITGLGLSEQEAGSITDHRLVIAINESRLYREMTKSGMSGAKKKIAKTPRKVVTGGQPQSKAEKTAAASQQQRANLKNSGSIDDAVAMLLTGS